MSIHAAVSELNKEIERLTKIRDSLLVGAATASTPVTEPITARTGSRKAAPIRKAAQVKKRVLSAEGRKKISEASKRRWAATRKAAAAK